MENNWIVVLTIVVGGVVLVLALRKYSELDAEIQILDWFKLKLFGKRPNGDDSLEDELQQLLWQHNEDFVRAVKSNDPRYLATTTSAQGFVQAQQNVNDYIQSTRNGHRHDLKLRHISIIKVERVDKSSAHIVADEVWEHSYEMGNAVVQTIRNIYRVRKEGNRWKIDNAQILKPVLEH